MANVYPFASVSALGENAPRVATLPYDVMNRAEAAKMAAGNPVSFLRVTRSEIDLPDSVDPYDPAVYEKAAQNWQALKSSVLTTDNRPAFYVYSLVMNGRRQTGVVAAASVDDYDNNIVRKHEKTRKEKEDDRTRHITALRAQTGPVFLTYKDSAAIDDIVEKTMKTVPIFDFTAEDGISHTGWRVSDELTLALQGAFAAVPLLYIADGHHRAASASRTQAALKAAGTDSPESAHFLSVIFPAGQLKILAYNRVVFDLNGLTEEQFLQKITAAVESIAPCDNAEPSEAGQACMFFQGKWWQIVFKPTTETAGPVDKLDVSRLQNDVLSPILGIDDPRTSKKIDFVGGIRGTAELEKRVLSGEAKVAFSMYPTSLDQLMDIADDNAIMPPKSTWFEPKLRDGLFVHEI